MLGHLGGNLSGHLLPEDGKDNLRDVAEAADPGRLRDVEVNLNPGRGGQRRARLRLDHQAELVADWVRPHSDQVFPVRGVGVEKVRPAEEDRGAVLAGGQIEDA